MSQEQQQAVCRQLEIAVQTLMNCAAEERMIAHNVHWGQHYVQAVRLIESELTAQRALLKRIETVGR